MTFIDSNFDKKTGISTVTIEHLGKLFNGTARLHPDDKDKASNYSGCKYAEIRATIKALKYEHKIAKEEAEACRKMVMTCESCKNWDKKSTPAKILYHQLNVRIKKVNKLADMINAQIKNLQKMIWERDIVLKSIERVKSKKDNLSK